MQSEDQLAGWIDKNKFYLDFAEKMIIDHAGGEPVQKLGRQFQCISMKWINPWTHRLHVLIENQMFHISYYNKTGGKLSDYQLIIDPIELASIFKLDFNAYCMFYGITDEGDRFASGLRWE